MKDLNTTTEVLTVDEARRRLRVVEPLVERMRELVVDFERVQTDLATRPRKDETDEAAAMYELESIQGEVQEIIRAVNLQGAVVKSASDGLIDFFAWRNDEIVHLCWCHGEKSIDYWHGLDTGYAGRRLIDGDSAFA
ncbi:MAG: DUF2203 domain-containing protein [Planctomycetes bacterium]|nr:DUF2203 domain-containing protein [Planctomycetota bacterium]